MHIVIIGASGFIGEKVVNEALSRKHQVDAIFRRNPLPKQKGLTQYKMTLFDEAQLENIIKKADVIVSAYNPGYYHVAQKERYLDAYQVIFKIVKKWDKRIIVVIGATSLIQYDGELVKNGFYPKPWLKALEGPDLVYERYKDDQSLNLTFISPPAELIDGERTGHYTLGKNHLIYDKNFESRISVQDLAHAILNEIEKPQFERMRFTVAYSD